MRIAQYAPLDFSTFGGMQTVILWLARSLRELGHTVDIITGLPPEQEGKGFVSPERFDPSRYDLVHSHGHLCLPRALRKRFCPRVLHTLHGTTVANRLACRRMRALANPQNWLGIWGEVSGARDAGHVIAVSNAVRQEARRYYGVCPSRVSVVHNGHFLAAIQPESVDRQAWRQRLGIGDDEVVFLFVGREHDYVKNTFAVLSAVREVRRHEPLARLVMVPGEFADGESSLSTGRLTHLELSSLYCASDVYVSVSFYEACSLGVVEALGAGLPVLATPVGAAPELLSRSGAGALLLPNATDLASWMLKLVDDAGLRHRMAVAATRLGAEYTWEHVGRKTAGVYNEVLDHAR